MVWLWSVFGTLLKVPSNTGITITIYIVVCCVIGIAVQWKESGLEVDDEL